MKVVIKKKTLGETIPEVSEHDKQRIYKREEEE
jgi:hypothetical protein